MLGPVHIVKEIPFLMGIFQLFYLPIFTSKYLSNEALFCFKMFARTRQEVENFEILTLSLRPCSYCQRNPVFDGHFLAVLLTYFH